MRAACATRPCFFPLSRLRERVADEVGGERALSFRAQNPLPAHRLRRLATLSRKRERGRGVRGAIPIHPYVIARLSWRAGCAFSSAPPKGEAERRETRELARLPGDWRGHPARLRSVLPPLAIEEARLSALHGGSFRSRATLSRGHLRRLISQAPGGRSVVTSRWSPGSPGCGMPSARGNRVCEPFPVRPGSIRAESPARSSGPPHPSDASRERPKVGGLG